MTPFIATAYCTKDSFTFIKDIQEVSTQDSFMFSYDVWSLFTNIPLSEAINIAIKLLLENKKDLKFSENELTKLFCFATAQTHFYFDGKIFDQWALPYFRKRKPRKVYYIFSKRRCSYISGSNLKSLKNEKKPLLKCFLCFRKLNFSIPSLKISCFYLGEPLRVFHHCFFTIHFYYCFRVFLLLIAFVHFNNPRVFHNYFFRCFYFTTVFNIVFGVFLFHLHS